jgi:effector-binding domain-containing protein
MIDTPQIVQSDEQLTAVIHLCVPRAEINHVMGPAIQEIISALAAEGITPDGPCFSFHWKRPSDMFDFEVGFPINRSITPVGRVKMSKLPAVKVARTVYRGEYEGLAAAWAEFSEWIENERLNVQDSLWKCYLSGPELSPDPAEWRTELNRPLNL